MARPISKILFTPEDWEECNKRPVLPYEVKVNAVFNRSFPMSYAPLLDKSDHNEDCHPVEPEWDNQESTVRTIFSSVTKFHWLQLLAAATVVISLALFLLVFTQSEPLRSLRSKPVSEEKIAVAEEDYHNQESLVESSNETGQRVSDATNPPSDPPLQHFHFEPLSEEKKAAAAQCYLDQDNYIRIAQDLLNDLRRVKKNNSDPLPNRIFVGNNASEMCESGRADCIQPFARILPLYVVSPKHRLMSCLVQKTMSTVMSAIFCFLVRENEFVDAGRSILTEFSDIRLCEGRNEFHTVQNAQRALGLPDLDQWRFTVVTREPVDRFLSGFIDRCLRVGDDCFGCYGNMTCFLEEEYERAGAYALADKHGLRKHWPGMEDMHVFPQNWRCDMEKYFEKYQFIRYSNDPTGTLLEDLMPLLRSQNVSESSLRYISESLRSGRTAHSTVVSEARTYLEQRVRSSPYLMEMIVRLFYYDYKLFKYELPDLSALENLRNSN